MKVFTPSEVRAITALASELGIPPLWLVAMVDLESGWKPTAFNILNTTTGAAKVWDYRKPVPSGWKPFAAGLNQLIPATAVGLGLPPAQSLIAAYPTVLAQLQVPVRKYLSKMKPFTSPTDLYLANFYPAARKNPNQALPPKVAVANPSFRTFADAGRILESRIAKLSPQWKVYSTAAAHPVATGVGLGLVALGAAWAAYRYL